MVSTHLKNISQIGNLPQVGVKIKNIWNHHLEYQIIIFQTYWNWKKGFTLWTALSTAATTIRPIWGICRFSSFLCETSLLPWKSFFQLINPTSLFNFLLSSSSDLQRLRLVIVFFLSQPGSRDDHVHNGEGGDEQECHKNHPQITKQWGNKMSKWRGIWEVKSNTNDFKLIEFHVRNLLAINNLNTNPTNSNKTFSETFFQHKNVKTQQKISLHSLPS